MRTLWLVALTLPSFSSLTLAKEIIPECTLYFIRGHGNQVLSRSKSLREQYPGLKTLGLGCYIDTQADSIPSAIPIKNFVGDWMGSFDKDYNGGLIPRLTSSADPNADIRYLHTLSETLSTTDYNAQQLRNEWITETLAVGFEKLQSERWMRGLAHAVSEIGQRKCAEFKIQVDCPSSDKNDEVYATRLKEATETKIVHETTQKPIQFQTRFCGSDASKEYSIQNIPKSCGDAFTLNAKAAKVLAAGPCKKQIQYYRKFDEGKAPAVEASQQPVPATVRRDLPPPPRSAPAH